MEWIRNWLWGVIGSALVVAVIHRLTPSGAFRTMIKFLGGVVLVVAVIRPLSELSPDWQFSYEDCRSEVEEKIRAYRQENGNKMAEIIEAQLAAYISDRGTELGVECHPIVETRIENGVPYPELVRMDIPPENDLAEYMEKELGIPREKQLWQER